jgi:hypothetical protein
MEQVGHLSKVAHILLLLVGPAELYNLQLPFRRDKYITCTLAARGAVRPADLMAVDLPLELSTPGAAVAQQICGSPRSA